MGAGKDAAHVAYDSVNETVILSGTRVIEIIRYLVTINRLGTPGLLIKVESPANGGTWTEVTNLNFDPVNSDDEVIAISKSTVTALKGKMLRIVFKPIESTGTPYYKYIICQ